MDLLHLILLGTFLDLDVKVLGSCTKAIQVLEHKDNNLFIFIVSVYFNFHLTSFSLIIS